MIVLALDTAIAACSAAVLRQGASAPLAARLQAMDKGHAEALAPMVQEVMHEAGVGFADLNRIAVTTGPGTFTGVRIGLSFARGLGLALGLPVIGIDTLSAIAANETTGNPRLVVNDARKDEVYAALIGADGTVLRPPAVIAPNIAATDLPAGTRVMGTAAELIFAQAPQLTRSTAGDLPVAAHFGTLAFTAALPTAIPAPLYLRAADAKPQQGYALRPRTRTISPAGAEAAPLLAQIHGECFDNSWDTASLASLLQSPGALTLVAQEGDEPVGFLLVRQAADEAEIITIATRPFAQRSGVASLLLDAAFQQLRAAGVTQVFLEVATSNAAARTLYEAQGFVQSGLRKAYYERQHGAREDGLVMRKVLS